MAEIATYTCTNRECRLTVRLAHNLHNRSETFCASCKKITEYTSTHTCAACESKVEVELLSTTCYHCKAGTFTMPKLSVL